MIEGAGVVVIQKSFSVSQDHLQKRKWIFRDPSLEESPVEMVHFGALVSDENKDLKLRPR
jgi:hypothetical protein